MGKNRIHPSGNARKKTGVGLESPPAGFDPSLEEQEEEEGIEDLFADSDGENNDDKYFLIRRYVDERRTEFVFERPFPYSEGRLQKEAGPGEYKVYLKKGNEILSWRKVRIARSYSGEEIIPAARGEGEIERIVRLVVETMERKSPAPADPLQGFEALKNVNSLFNEMAKTQLEGIREMQEVMKKARENVTPSGTNDVISEGIQAAVSLVEQYFYFKNPELLALRNKIEAEKERGQEGGEEKREEQIVEKGGGGSDFMAMLNNALGLIGDMMRRGEQVEASARLLKKKFPMLGLVLREVEVENVEKLMKDQEGYNAEWVRALYLRVKG